MNTFSNICKRCLCLLVGIVLLFASTPRLCAADANPGECFLKNGDRWLFIGDSITGFDTYRQVVYSVLQHYHPDADIYVGNSAVNGVTSNFTAQSNFTPTVVTIMLGINNVIHRDWSFTPDTKASMEAYRKDMSEQVRKYKKLGAEVVLMTPTYPDERFPTFFNVAMTRRFLEGYGQVIREVAVAEGCHWVPVAEEMEAYQDTLGIDQALRPDGVHPLGLGQYQIARTLCQHMNFSGKLSGSRKMVSPDAPLLINARLTSRFMNQPANGVALALSAQIKTIVKATWNIGKTRGVADLVLEPAATTWQIPVPATELEIPVGSYKRLVIDFTAGNSRHLCVIDLARTRVLKLKDGKFSGEIATGVDRQGGKQVATWELEDKGISLWFSGQVMNPALHWDSYFPFGRDGIQLWLDLRPPDRFADIGIDRDMALLFLSPRDQPYFTMGLVPWIGPHMIYATWINGEKTPGGYRWRLGLDGKVSDVRDLELKKRDYIGFNLNICGEGKNFPAQTIDAPDPATRPNLMMILDRKGVFPGDATTNLHLFQ